MLRVLESAFDEISFYLLELELLLEIINDKVDVDAVLASVDVGGYKAALRKRMNADVALGNHENTAPTARVFNMIIGSGVDLHMRLTEGAHSKRIAKPCEARKDCLVVVESVMVAIVSVNGYVLTKMG